MSYFVKEQTRLKELNIKLEQIASHTEELKNEYGGEDGLLSEVIENDKIKKGDIQKRIKEVKGDSDYADELKVLEQYAAFFEEEANTKKRIKEVEQELEKKVLAKYPALTPKEILSLVVDNKWMDELQARVMSEVERLSQKLAGRVKELTERYAEPIPKISDEVSELTKKVEGNLTKMGFKWK